ncbi:MAG: hypothetical protein JO062_23530, partial [Bryobacterales bacterium]|nr:hypothetical protein [Bryobacterales bacterium]
PPTGELVSIRKAAQILGMNTSSIHRWLADGFIAGEQVTPGAPWQIRITDELRARIVQESPPESLPGHYPASSLLRAAPSPCRAVAPVMSARRTLVAVASTLAGPPRLLD